MDPRLQAGLELQLEKQAQQEYDSSLSGVLGRYFKQAEETAEDAKKGQKSLAARHKMEHGRGYGSTGNVSPVAEAAPLKDQTVSVGGVTRHNAEVPAKTQLSLADILRSDSSAWWPTAETTGNISPSKPARHSSTLDLQRASIKGGQGIPKYDKGTPYDATTHKRNLSFLRRQGIPSMDIRDGH
jgi:hypothetical protein